LQRAISYTMAVGMDLFWIDGECVEQDNGEEKEIAIQSMDLVYSWSRYPVGLLSVPIISQRQIRLLYLLLRGDFLDSTSTDRKPRLNSKFSMVTITEVIELLKHITSDPWWSRGWVFQEEYRSSGRMQLLIPHARHLKKPRDTKVLGNIPGELNVNSATFRTQTSLFCSVLLRQNHSHVSASGVVLDMRAQCSEILKKAKQYNISATTVRAVDGKSLKSMSSTIFADVGRRHITKHWDLVAIVANCCAYSSRLETTTLRHTKYSLSLSILVLFLMNGEIFKNGKRVDVLPCDTIFDVLDKISLSGYKLPVDSKRLTFLKRCRFVDVKLRPAGVLTTGWLWTLSKRMNITKAFLTRRCNADRKVDYSHGLSKSLREKLRQLAAVLRRDGHYQLIRYLYKYLDEDDCETASKRSTLKPYQNLMVGSIIKAIEENTPIRLGRLEGRTYYSGIFVGEEGLGGIKNRCMFTAWKPAGHNGKGMTAAAAGYVDSHVSLMVDRVNDLGRKPCLVTRKWVNGLCFWGDAPPTKVIFPWPIL